MESTPSEGKGHCKLGVNSLVSDSFFTESVEARMAVLSVYFIFLAQRC